MARQKNKVCPGCQRIFRARFDATTCSDRCRKRLQRARLASPARPLKTAPLEHKSGVAA